MRGTDFGNFVTVFKIVGTRSDSLSTAAESASEKTIECQQGRGDPVGAAVAEGMETGESFHGYRPAGRASSNTCNGS